ncbi:MAG: Riboflavin biosynthesis protein RibF [Flavobacteriia bacterium]|nr:MAG: Riboflavin biosynthesis protein RibF [Flavobacteriia bacterium]
MAISSTKIRNALKDGDMERANLFLGYTYGVDAEVVQGDRMGRTIGFPTANCRFAEMRKVIPGDGVYAVQVEYGDRVIDGMCHIGRRPTVDDAAESRVEVHLLDFKEDLYGQTLRLSFVRRVRDVQRFEGMQQLKEQLEQDEKVVRELLGQSGSEE